METESVETLRQELETVVSRQLLTLRPLQQRAVAAVDQVFQDYHSLWIVLNRALIAGRLLPQGSGLDFQNKHQVEAQHLEEELEKEKALLSLSLTQVAISSNLTHDQILAAFDEVQSKYGWVAQNQNPLAQSISDAIADAKYHAGLGGSPTISPSAFPPNSLPQSSVNTPPGASSPSNSGATPSPIHTDIFELYSRDTLYASLDSDIPVRGAASAANAESSPLVETLPTTAMASGASKGPATVPPFLDLIGQIAAGSIGTLATGAFDAYEHAMERAAQTGHFGAAAFGAAMKGVAANTVKSIGQQSMAKGAFEVGEGISAAAKGDHSSGKHFASAAQFFAVAAIAGAAGGAMSPGAAGGPKEKKSDAPAPVGANPSGATGGGAGSGVTQQITVIGVPDDDQVRGIRMKLRSAA